MKDLTLSFSLLQKKIVLSCVEAELFYAQKPLTVFHSSHSDVEAVLKNHGPLGYRECLLLLLCDCKGKKGDTPLSDMTHITTLLCVVIQSSHLLEQATFGVFAKTSGMVCQKFETDYKIYKSLFFYVCKTGCCSNLPYTDKWSYYHCPITADSFTTIFTFCFQFPISLYVQNSQ
jgi:hypothetical protein